MAQLDKENKDVSCLRQLFGITTRMNTAEQKLHRSNRKALATAMNYEKERDTDNFLSMLNLSYFIGILGFPFS